MNPTLPAQPAPDAPLHAAVPQLPRRMAASADLLLDALRRRYGDRIVGELRLPAKTARLTDFPPALDHRVVQALAARGITQLYSHQREAVDAALDGHHVVVATPTASGKSLCYQLPALHARLADHRKALFLFPTKALAQDQVADLHTTCAAGKFPLRVHTFDGDTPADARKAVRLHADIVVSNPDMLHQGMLPHHTRWAQFFENLGIVVIDELHTCRGIYGSHVANVIRRLRRVLRFYGANPTFLMCSATIANPCELAEQLIEAPVLPVVESGAPHGERKVVIWNPPLVNGDLGIRASTRKQAACLARHSVRRGLKTIVFGNSRLGVEVLARYLKDVFDGDPRKPARIAAYRGGYLPGERRQTERSLRSGTIDCVVSTCALELGVDIGSLDVCLLDGYPGSIASTWQRLGRAGRRNRPSLGILIAGSRPVDQYLAHHPQFLFDRSPEHARIAPDQLLILMDHVRCAAFELPFVATGSAGERFGGEDLRALLAYLEEQGVLHREGDAWHWIADGYPANSVNLRSVADGNFTVIDTTDGKHQVVAEVDHASAALTLYEGAIHLIQAEPYQVERLDWTGRKAFVTRTGADYWTDAIDYTRLRILDEFDAARDGERSVGHGEVHVVRRVAGYKKIRYYTHENVGYGPVNLPDHEMATTAVWWQLDESVLDRVFPRRELALAGFLGAAYALHHVAAMLSMTETADIGRAVGDGSGTWSAVVAADGRTNLRRIDDAGITPDGMGKRFRPTIFLYDNVPGGIGLAAPLFGLREELTRRASQLISACRCSEGCPACTGPRPATTGTDPPQAMRHAALRILELLGSKDRNAETMQ